MWQTIRFQAVFNCPSSAQADAEGDERRKPLSRDRYVLLDDLDDLDFGRTGLRRRALTVIVQVRSPLRVSRSGLPIGGGTCKSPLVGRAVHVVAAR